MDIPIAAAKHIQLILLGIWPVNLLTLWAQGHAWGRAATPAAVMDLWEWGAFVAFSLAVLAELGGKMFFAQLEHRRKMAKAREEGRKEGLREGLKVAEESRAEGREEGRKEGREEGRKEGVREGMRAAAESRAESRDMLTVLDAAARTSSPELLQELLREYQARYQNGASGE